MIHKAEHIYQAYCRSGQGAAIGCDIFREVWEALRELELREPVAPGASDAQRCCERSIKVGLCANPLLRLKQAIPAISYYDTDCWIVEWARGDMDDYGAGDYWSKAIHDFAASAAEDFAYLSKISDEQLSPHLQRTKSVLAEYFEWRPCTHPPQEGARLKCKYCGEEQPDYRTMTVHAAMYSGIGCKKNSSGFHIYEGTITTR